MFELCWMWIFPWIKLTWHSCSMWDKLGWLNGFWDFLCKGLSSFNWKGLSHSYAWSCSLCEKRTSFGKSFAPDLSLENSPESYLCFWLALLHTLSYFFFLFRSHSSSLVMVFYSISSTIDEVLTINPSANVFVFGDFNVYHRDWLTYSGETDRAGKLSYNFSTVCMFLSCHVHVSEWIHTL